jgi:hypothetical protein
MPLKNRGTVAPRPEIWLTQIPDSQASACTGYGGLTRQIANENGSFTLVDSWPRTVPPSWSLTRAAADDSGSSSRVVSRAPLLPQRHAPVLSGLDDGTFGGALRLSQPPLQAERSVVEADSSCLDRSGSTATHSRSQDLAPWSLVHASRSQPWNPPPCPCDRPLT